MAKWIVYGSELSPFALKVRAMCRWMGLPHQFFTREASTWEAARVQLRKELLVRGRLPLTWPKMTAEDEFPLVPFLFGVLVLATALARGGVTGQLRALYAGAAFPLPTVGVVAAVGSAVTSRSWVWTGRGTKAARARSNKARFSGSSSSK